MSLTLSDPNQERKIRDLANLRKESPEKVLKDIVGQALSESRNGDAGDSRTVPHGFFDPPPSLEALSAAQGVEPLSDVNALSGDFWPEDETADDFIATVRKWRREGGNEHGQ